MENPYAELLKIIYNTNPKENKIQLAKVINNNCIKIGKLQLTREDYLTNEYLVEHPLNNGDIVAIYPIENGQRYIVLCKVV